ncbi:MAG: hypothetical protein QOF48_2438 [Verrucomicrobiota bacterium]
MHPTQIRKHVQDHRGFDKGVVMVGQHAPRLNVRTALFKRIE